MDAVLLAGTLVTVPPLMAAWRNQTWPGGKTTAALVPEFALARVRMLVGWVPTGTFAPPGAQGQGASNSSPPVLQNRT